LTGLIFVHCVPALAAPTPQGTLVVGLNKYGNETFLPDVMTSGEAILYENVYDYLLYTDTKTGGPIPGLDTKWEMSKDCRTLTLWYGKVSSSMRDGEFAAEDVKFTFERVC
jgi:ABC-type transport system substrate-binding protein